jgi:hypothetical protein
VYVCVDVLITKTNLLIDLLRYLLLLYYLISQLIDGLVDFSLAIQCGPTYAARINSFMKMHIPAQLSSRKCRFERNVYLLMWCSLS